MEYLFLLFADLFLAANFVITKIYQKDEGVSLAKALKFNLFLGLFTAVAFFAFSGFQIEFSLYSLLMVTLHSGLAVAYTVLGLKVMEQEKVSLYTMFLMTGGMIIPYIFGLFYLNEAFSVWRTLGLVCIVVAILLSNLDTAKISGKQILLCCAIFLLNGGTSVVGKLHQINPVAISSSAFVLWGGVAKVVLCGILLLFIKDKPEEGERKRASFSWQTILWIVAAAMASGVSFLLQLVGAKSLPASVLYPIVTGGSIIFTALAGRIFFREKIGKKSVAGLLLCLFGTCLFL